MFYIGKTITNSSQDILEEISIEDLYAIIKTDVDLKVKIESIRRVLEVDVRAYNNLKRGLPYFCGVDFNPNIRNTNNFVQINHFIMDYDHFNDEEDINSFFDKLRLDERVVLLFRSPSANGLKIVFNLHKPILETKEYTDFYKTFVIRFSEEYGMSEYIDTKTNDVTRVCFLSFDENVFFNPIPVPIQHTPYLMQNKLFGVKEDEEVLHKVKQNPIPPLIYKQILSKLKPEAPKKSNKKYFVPDVLETILDPIKNLMHEHEIEILCSRDISFGKQLELKHLSNLAELNIYYGKKGFTIVNSNKAKINKDFQAVVYRLIHNLIYG